MAALKHRYFILLSIFCDFGKTMPFLSAFFENRFSFWKGDLVWIGWGYELSCDMINGSLLIMPANNKQKEYIDIPLNIE